MKQLLIALACGVLLSMSSLAHAQTMQSFAKNEYYLGTGGTPPTLIELTIDPKRYFRHDLAYQVFKQRFETVLGTGELNDTAFVVLLLSEDVQLVPCIGQIKTSGIDSNGKTSAFWRNCYAGEELIQLRKEGTWHTVASLGCLNEVFDQRLPVVKPVPKRIPKPVPEPRISTFTVVPMAPTPGFRVVQETVHVHDCECGHITCGSYTAGRVIPNFTPSRGSATFNFDE